MKTPIFAPLVLVAGIALTGIAQTKSNNRTVPPKSQPIQTGNPVNGSRVRILGTDTKAESMTLVSNPVSVGTAKSDGTKVTAAQGPASMSPRSPNVSSATNTPVLPSQIYRVGVRDVLDIQLSENPVRGSTLFTVLDGGFIEYPFARDPIRVAGLTTAEIAILLRKHIKVFENPKVAVNVREYASHSVTVSGLVASPGIKTLRREAMPLYAVLAESLVLPEAARATITRQGKASIEVNLKDSNSSATLVMPGDVIKVSGLPPGPTEFFFIGGEINSPGQKGYHAGLTLTQAILASGGATATAGAKVRVSRQGRDGLLATTEYNLQKIQAGKAPDPSVQKDDRIEVTRAN